MNNWKDYLPEMNLNVQMGPASNRMALTLHCSLRQRIANLSLEVIPDMDELYKTSQEDLLNPYSSFMNSGECRKHAPDVN